MRILFDSKQLQFKDPFGTLIPEQICTLRIHIPASVQATQVECIVLQEDCSPAFSFYLDHMETLGPYQIFSGDFFFNQTGLYFYYFHISTQTGGFRLFK